MFLFQGLIFKKSEELEAKKYPLAMDRFKKQNGIVLRNKINVVILSKRHKQNSLPPNKIDFLFRLRRFFLYVSLFCFGIFQILILHCCKTTEVSVNEIEKYTNSEFTSKSNASEFFQRRMQNRPRKALVGNWEILFENKEFIYYGYPRFKGLFSDERVVEKIYFTSKQELEKQFPQFRTLTGQNFRLKLYEQILQYKKSNHETENFTLGFQDFSATLKEETIETIATIHLSTFEAKKNKSEKYNIIFRKNDLTILKIEKQTKTE